MLTTAIITNIITLILLLIAIKKYRDKNYCFKEVTALNRSNGKSFTEYQNKMRKKGEKFSSEIKSANTKIDSLKEKKEVADYVAGIRGQRLLNSKQRSKEILRNYTEKKAKNFLKNLSIMTTKVEPQKKVCKKENTK